MEMMESLEESEKILTFYLTYEDYDAVLQFSEYDSVEILKIGVHNVFGIPPHNQIIDGWKNTPNGDNTILQFCADEEFTCLTVRTNNMDGGNMTCNAGSTVAEELEVEASVSFINKTFNNNGPLSVIFQSCTLENAVTNTCLAPLEKKKILLLYLHNPEDVFSSTFIENLNNSDVASVLQRNFFILGWDLSETKYHTALINAITNRAELSNLTDLIRLKIAAAILIVGINDSVTVSSIMRGNIANKDFLKTLIETENFCTDENNQEKALEDLKGETSKNDFGSVQYQKLMADMLGDRDYDCFEFDQHDYLKNKIAYALMGPPKNEQGYEAKSLKVVDKLCKVILKNSNEIAKYKDRVEMAFIYNCVEPLPSEKCRRSKKYKDYNPNTDLSPYPIFVLRKCHGSDNPCRVFIDHAGRTYSTWREYITRNKLHECEMVLPLNGRYDVDNNGEVLLEKHLSPACSASAKFLQGADIFNVAGGLISGGLLATASLTSIAFAPAILVTAGATCIGMGIYSMGRSAYTLYDRSRHRESMSFSNSEVRGAYLNIVAGSLGFVGAGATMAVSQLASKGVNIGTGAGAVVNTIGFVNIGASGVSLINSGYDVFDQWYSDNQSPSLLTIVQLSSSILFFGNAVYNFKMCSTIVEETQSRTLRDYQDSLRSNRHRKTFSKLLKETVRQNNNNHVKGRAEVISAIRSIQDRDEVFAVLTRSNKEMNKRGIKITAADGEIRLNGVQIDMNEFMNMNKRNAKSFLIGLSKMEVTPVETTSMKKVIFNTLKNIDVDMETFANYTLRLLQNYNSDIKAKIISALASIVAKFTFEITDTLDEIFPNHQKFYSLMDMVVGFFGKAADSLEDRYQMWLSTGREEYYMPLFDYVNVDKLHRAVQFFETSVNMYYRATHFTEEGARQLLNYFYNWLTKQVYEYQQRIESNNRRTVHSAGTSSKKIDCPVCGGYYFQLVTG